MTSRIHFAMDCSASMASMSNVAYDSAKEVLGLADTVVFTTFNSDVKMGEPVASSDFDQTQICRIATGTTSLYDTILAVCASEREAHAAAGHPEGWSTLFLTDGHDTSSKSSAADANEAVAAVRKSGIALRYIGANQGMEYINNIGFKTDETILFDVSSPEYLQASMRAVSRTLSEPTNQAFTHAERQASLGAAQPPAGFVARPPALCRQRSMATHY